ncbi:NAD-dependent epimerase/dehydratase family protein [Demequina sp. TTPB684]|uniref:NAD-dependent epimerase/dehydratase family protein n=1 Tax=unclassified Demequina TaxID=2620311 RepID=UPI001CF36AE8|nr:MULTISPECIES: NAD-dependent epimerase/dehydratase family protein [unclassified Demequina]MCB2413043.1 NAD-dependent epimerase/dehydratase family protein [Demequina sp. TTPB684]UPU89460.1 NAD-dependent epimerase/dehydratase family protein [Demequina sp. TMPB413]
MRILVVGGTGLISSAFADACAARGDDLTLITRGRPGRQPAPPTAKTIHVDATDAPALRAALRGPRLRGERWDAVVQFIAFSPEQVHDDVETFAPVTDRYVLIATAAAYTTFDHFHPLTEDTPLSNRFWDYAQQKIACEQALVADAPAAGLGYTIVRPAHTYGDSKIPAYTGNSRHPWTIVDRMRRGADIIIPGDGTALWTVTHASDVAAGIRGLLSADAAVGRAVHVTSDEALTWTGLYAAIARAAGLTAEQFAAQAVYVPSDAIIAAAPGQLGSIRGDKMHSAVFDTSLVKELVPGWSAAVPFSQGVADAIAAFESHHDWCTVDDDANAMFDRLGTIYRSALRSVTEG